MTRYRAEYHGTGTNLTVGQEYDVVLAEFKTYFEMRVHPALTVSTRHRNVEHLLNTWRNLRPVKINNTDV